MKKAAVRPSDRPLDFIFTNRGFSITSHKLRAGASLRWINVVVPVRRDVSVPVTEVQVNIARRLQWIP